MFLGVITTIGCGVVGVIVMEQKGLPDGLVKRVYTQTGADPFDAVAYEKRDVCIANTKGEITFERKGIEVPSSWSQLATQILAEKYVMKKGVPITGDEVGARQVVHRISNTIRNYGEIHGYFSSKDEGDTFEAELSYMLINQYGAFNSPVWFNVGHYQQYGIKGDGKHNYYWNPDACRIDSVSNTYEHPQCSACFIISVDDSLESMMGLQKNEVMLFKGGSGTGTNFSKIRGASEFLSSGGVSSGLISFMKGFDAWAGVIKSGGATRRAAKMVVLNADHPEIEDFIVSKASEERVVKECYKGGNTHFEAGAYKNAWWQNANNSVRVTDEFMQAVLAGGVWATRERTTGKVRKEYKARSLWNLICESAWECGDPGIQFDMSVNKWHTCKESGRINASNPCSEYMFIDDSACNLASLNLMKFLKKEGDFDTEKFRHACDVFILAQEMLVDMSSYPTEKIARNSHDFRPLGLGYSNLGTLLMMNGIPYDSEKGRMLAGAITSIMTGCAYAQSAKIAARKMPFAGYEQNKESMLGVLKMHRKAIENLNEESIEHLVADARADWDSAIELGERYGYRNAQTTLLAPTGTISLLMDCDTLGIEPETTFCKVKKLSGGGEVTITNQSVPLALAKLGYGRMQTDQIVAYAYKHGHIEGAPYLSVEHYAVFDCALKPEGAARFISPMGHVKMLAAAQPFLSGAISKTVNLPKDATVKDISDIYIESWKLGLKAIALYRDGSKFSQPLNVKKNEKSETLEQKLGWGDRKRLESIREGITVSATIGGHALILRTGEYSDGTVGEFFIDMFDDGAEFKGALHSWAVSSSIGLQHGWGLEHFVKKFLHNKSAPNGIVTEHPYIKMCDSIYQFVARVLAVEYLGKTEYANILPDPIKLRINVCKAVKELTELTTKDASIIQRKQEADSKHAQDKVTGELCYHCGALMVRSGTCYVCTGCGTTSGCS